MVYLSLLAGFHPLHILELVKVEVQEPGSLSERRVLAKYQSESGKQEALVVLHYTLGIRRTSTWRLLPTLS